LIVAVHASWIATLWLLGPGLPIHVLPLVLFIALQGARAWVIATLGERWTTRIIILPGAPLVRAGPYRWVDHPNYLIVIGEIAVLPLVFGLPLVALFFSLLNAVVLWVRIREENKALSAAP
jgi:methyltransferase